MPHRQCLVVDLFSLISFSHDMLIPRRIDVNHRVRYVMLDTHHLVPVYASAIHLDMYSTEFYDLFFLMD